MKNTADSLGLGVALNMPKKTGTKLIRPHDSKRQCRCSSHLPASMMVRKPGWYQHTCPACGQSFSFSVPDYLC